MTNKLGVDIREATEEDIVGIVYVQATSWIKNYQSKEQGINEEDIRSIDFQDKLAQWHHILKSPNYKVWVAKDEPNVLAFIAARKDQDSGEVYQQHTLPEHQRQGIGSQLLKNALLWLKDCEEVNLRIPVYVRSGLDFYKKFGFQVNEEGELDFIRLGSGKKIPTFVMKITIIKQTQPNLDQIKKSEPTKEAIIAQSSVKPYQKKSKNNSKIIGRAKLAAISGVRASTIKYYTEIGLLPYEQAESRLARRYNKEKALMRLQEIKNLKQKGLTIGEIKEQMN